MWPNLTHGSKNQESQKFQHFSSSDLFSQFLSNLILIRQSTGHQKRSEVRVPIFSVFSKSLVSTQGSPKAPSLSQLCSWLHSCLLVPGWCKSQTLRTGIRTQYREKKPGYQWTSCWPWAWKITVRLVLISWVVIGSETGDLVRIIDSIFFTQASDVPDYAKPIS